MQNIKNHLYQLEVGADGIAILTINQTNNAANLFSDEFLFSFFELAQKVIQDDTVKGLILTSGRRIFMAGADLNAAQDLGSNPTAQLEKFLQFHKGFRNIEKGEKPFVAAINGTALGGGLELCLVCHHRIALNNPKIKLGFPEAKVGLLPGAGGTVKTPYLIGLQKALQYILQGKELRPQQALKDGLIDEVAETPDALIEKAKAWILANPNPIQPWDNKKYRMPEGGLWTPKGMQTLMGTVGNLTKMTSGNYPAQNFIVKVMHDAIQVPIDRALEIEARYFTKLTTMKETKNMIKTGFLAMQAARKGKARPKNEPKYEIKKLGILGAGMMGAGIAYVSAKAGMEVILKDLSVAGAEKGKAYSAKLLDKAIAKNRSTEAKKTDLLAKIHPTDDPNSVADCDLVIEAVFEDPKIKDIVTKETETVLGTNKIYASNTSTIPISLLAKSSKRPENFIGIHFFSPVDKMPLVEIIVGRKTGQKAIAAAVDYSVAIGKVPIVVNDSRGFYTSRCFGQFTAEGMFLLEEGVPAAMIENITKQQGMPVGPLAVLDEVTLTLSLHIIESDPTPNKPEHILRNYRMFKDLVEKHGRTSKKDGKGFYDYPEGGKKKLWKGLEDLYQPDIATYDHSTIAKRIMHRQALEAYRCLDEGVLNSTTDGDIGSVLGWGFPIYTGGALSYIDYVGMQQFIADCDDFAKRFGPRWEVPQSLRDLSDGGKSVHDFKRAATAAVATTVSTEVVALQETPTRMDSLTKFAKAVHEIWDFFLNDNGTACTRP